ncbi:MAG TPA: thiamine phosphate synthase [Nitrospirales bacterium]|nr:thiamine phosphate synthase [Nitrospirales bacterium]HIA14160.1 thiamine phosphate synthase [Nitrospirales bacterium]HIB54662.1 thiamine phosphate synthase [Nitrospirales bacterium]HIC04036.1 thiamine phosphate synthase [Nitrospirales bacterium]HIN34114.1 thiamine phosphate synthase [Nitrospirales bacterium]
MPRVDFSLYLITDRHRTVDHSLHVVITDALDHGAGAVQVREKDLPIRSLLTLTREIAAATKRCGAQCFVNDRVDVCLSVPGVGIHLRSDSLPVDKVRRLVGPDRVIAVSTHSSDEVQRAEQQGADFVVLGPIYDTPSKRAFGAPLGPTAIDSARSKSRLPIFAIGGITLESVGEVMGAGASGIAVISAIMAAPDVGLITRALCAEIDRHRTTMQ